MSIPPVTVRVFGSLRPSCDERGVPYVFTVEIPEEGMSARDIASAAELPLDLIEGVFVNHTVHGLNVRVNPGDRIAFVPNDTPGPHRMFLGLYSAGKDDDA
jgi:molybdopterin converting factor small subunit